MELMHILGYIGAVATGLVLGMLGGGGAALSIPVLVYLFKIPPSVATGYSLFLVTITAFSGAVQNIRQKFVDYDAAFYYGLPSMITVYCMRRFVMPAIPPVIFSTGNFTLSKDLLILSVLSIVMFGAAYKMITATHDEQEMVSAGGIDRIKLPLYAVLIGIFLGLVGAGGGFLMIPAFIYFAHLPMRKAVGTSLVLVAANSFIGFIGDLHGNPNMDWKFLLIFSGFSIAGVLTGTYLHKFIHGHKMRSYFGWFMLLVAVLMVIKEISKAF